MPPRRITLSTVGLLPALERLAQRADDAEPRHLAARADRRAARRARADQPEVRRQRHHRGVQAISAAEAQPHHVRIRAARRASTTRPRTRGGSRSSGRREIEGEPDSAQRRRRAFRSSGRRTRRSIASRGSSPSTASTVSVRKSRGRDIRAACGQLIVEGPKKSAAQQLAVDALTSTLHAAPTRSAHGPAESGPSGSSPSPRASRPRASARGARCRSATRGNARPGAGRSRGRGARARGRRSPGTFPAIADAAVPGRSE